MDDVKAPPKINGEVASQKTRRKRRPSPSGEIVLEQSFDLFAKFGYDGTTIDLITDSVGVTKRTLYDKYGDKDALFQAALRHAIAKWIVPDEALRACECDDLEETLAKIAFRLLENLLSPRGLELLQMTSALSGRMPQLAAHNVRYGVKPTLTYLADLFRRRIDTKPGGFLSAEGAGMAFLNLTVGGLANYVAWGISLEDEFINNYVTASVKLFLTGILNRIDPKDHQSFVDENVKLKLILADLFIKERDV